MLFNKETNQKLMATRAIGDGDMISRESGSPLSNAIYSSVRGRRGFFTERNRRHLDNIHEREITEMLQSGTYSPKAVLEKVWGRCGKVDVEQNGRIYKPYVQDNMSLQSVLLKDTSFVCSTADGHGGDAVSQSISEVFKPVFESCFPDIQLSPSIDIHSSEGPLPVKPGEKEIPALVRETYEPQEFFMIRIMAAFFANLWDSVLNF